MLRNRSLDLNLNTVSVNDESILLKSYVFILSKRGDNKYYASRTSVNHIQIFIIILNQLIITRDDSNL